MKPKDMAAVAAILFGLAAPGARAIVAGQVDDFESGTTQGWGSGASNPHPPVNVPTGGPAGAGDHYMSITSDGSGPGGKLVAFNTAQWTGDYPSAGVSSLAMDVNNLGPTSLSLRISIGDGVGGGVNHAVTSAVEVPSGSGWMAVSFSVDAASMAAVTGSVATALANAKEVRIVHSPDAGAPANITAELGVDNIRAISAGTPRFTQEDLIAALQIAGGLKGAAPQEAERLNVVDPTATGIDLNDAIRLARKVTGLEANP